MNRLVAVRNRTIAAVARCGEGKCLRGAALTLAIISALPAVGRAQPVVLEPRQPAAAAQTNLDIGRWCTDHRIGVSASNPAALKRLKAAQADLAPGFDPGARKDGIALLSAYQQELESDHPDRNVAAAYLALLSTIPVTLEVVERVNALLCISSPPAFARWIAAAAEQQRQQMAR